MTSIDAIIDQACTHWAVERDDVIGLDRSRGRVMYCRYSAMRACDAIGHTHTAIGARFGRTNGAVNNALKNITPEVFGDYWNLHHAFMNKVVAASLPTQDMPDPVTPVMKVIDVQIMHVDAQIRILQESRARLVALKEGLRR